jgi:hypothetical protein
MGVRLFAWRDGNPRAKPPVLSHLAPPLGLTVEYGDNVTGDGALMLAEARGTRVRASRAWLAF